MTRQMQTFSIKTKMFRSKIILTENISLEKSKNPNFYNGNPIIKVCVFYDFLKNRLFPNFIRIF